MSSFGGGDLDVFWGGAGGPGEVRGEFGEIEEGGAALDGQRRHVVGPGGHFRGGEGSEPDS